MQSPHSGVLEEGDWTSLASLHYFTIVFILYVFRSLQNSVKHKLQLTASG